MCGIGGILRITPPGERHEPIPEPWLDALDAGVAWRGPDGAGRFRDRVTRPDGTVVEVALVYRRLAIIDLEGGAQPMTLDTRDCPACAAKAAERRRQANTPSKRGAHEKPAPDPTNADDPARFAVVFNGCIYNHRELRASLEAEGHLFATDHSDTEVILHGFTEWGSDHSAFSEKHGEIDGMYALAIWDGATGTLSLGRSRFGEKPLFEARAGQGCVLLFTSGPGPLVGALRLVDPARCETLDPAVLTDLVALGVSANYMPFASIKEHPTPAATACAGSAPRSTDIEELLELSVARRLEADVPLGCFLSGGVDSSLVALMASRHVPGLVTLTVRMPDDRYDESRYAEMVADRLGTRHTTLDCDGRSAASDLVRLIEVMGLPFGDSSILPTYWLCREARRHVKVALAGDGGDELFLGYDRYKAARYLWWPKRWLAWLYPSAGLDRSDPTSLDERKARLVTAARHAGYLDLLAIFPTPDRRALLGPARGALSGRRHVHASAASMRAFDLEHYLPGDLLRKVDTASMLAGVEVRCPFLAPELTAAALRLPARRHMRDGEGKHILKEIARRHLPIEAIDRPKRGFAIPISDWFRRDFGGLGGLLLDRLSRAQPFGAVHESLPIRMDFVRRMIDEHWTAGGLTPRFTTREVRARDHGQRLFALLCLSLWSDSLK